MTRLKKMLKKRYFFLEIEGAHIPDTPVLFHKILEVNRIDLALSLIIQGKKITYSNMFGEHLEKGKQYLVLESKFLFNYAKV